VQGFDEYLLGESRSANAAHSEWKLPAPQFKVSSLDGKTFESKSLQGKIVVLNMWFIGCGPCRKEIPKLNEVVREFKGRDVVFIAPAPDTAESLRDFLKTVPFDYSIVAEADRILDQFNIAAFPTHIVIDRNGQVEAMMAGAAERRRLTARVSEELQMKPILQRLLCLTFLILFAFGSSSFAQAVDQSALDALMNEAMKHWQTPGAAIVIVRGDEVVYLKGFGVRDVKTKEPVTPDTVFAIGSTTKAFVTAALAMLADDGKLSWDDPVRKHLPYFRLSDPLANENVTLRDTVTHRTGLVRHDLLWYNSPWSREEIIKRVGFVPLTYGFRTTFQYQNIMFLTAGQAVGAAAGSTFEEFVQKRIFDPLGMKSANFSTLKAEKAPDHASPHSKQGSEIKTIPWRNLDNVGPAGSINASVRDLAGWIRLHLNDGVVDGRRLISSENLREMHTPQMVIRLEGRWKLFFPESETSQLSYGLGWFINDYRGHKLVMHGGTIDGFRASIVLAPKSKLGVAVLSNLTGTQMPEATCYNVVDLLLGLPKKDWNGYIGEEAKKFEAEQAKAILARQGKRHANTKPSRELAAYAGTYQDAAYGQAQVLAVDNKLVIQWSNLKSRLEHFHYDIFTAMEEALRNEQAAFTLGADGEVSAMNFLGVSFKKVKAKAPAQLSGQ
jgi:CubicO group peptidase (beta-lactamase class C family)